MPQAKLPFYQDPQFWRPQTWWLLASLALLAACGWLPLVGVDAERGSVVQTLLHQQVRGSSGMGKLGVYSSMAAGALALGILAALLAYRQLNGMQARIRIALLLYVGIVLALVVQLYIAGLGTVRAQHLEPGAALLLAVPLCMYLALRAAGKDAERLRGMDRFW